MKLQCVNQDSEFYLKYDPNRDRTHTVYVEWNAGGHTKRCGFDLLIFNEQDLVQGACANNAYSKAMDSGVFFGYNKKPLKPAVKNSNDFPLINYKDVSCWFLGRNGKSFGSAEEFRDYLSSM